MKNKSLQSGKGEKELKKKKGVSREKRKKQKFA